MWCGSRTDHALRSKHERDIYLAMHLEHKLRVSYSRGRGFKQRIDGDGGIPGMYGT